MSVGRCDYFIVKNMFILRICIHYWLFLVSLLGVLLVGVIGFATGCFRVT